MRDVGNVRRVLHIWRWSMIGRKGVVRSLAHHVVPIRVAIRRLAHRRTCLVARVVEVRGRDLRAPLRRWSIATVRARWRLHWSHPITGNKRLRLGIERVTVEAARDGVLALWVTGIDVGREGTICVGYTVRSHWRGSRLVRARIEAGGLLPSALRLRWALHRWSVWCRRHLIHRRLITRWTGRLGILWRRLSVYIDRIMNADPQVFPMTYVRHVVIWRAITIRRHHRRELLVRWTIHVCHHRRKSLLLYGAVELGTCWHVMRLSPCRLVRVPVCGSVRDVVGPGIKGVRISPFLCLLCAVDPVSHRYRAGARNTGAIVVL